MTDYKENWMKLKNWVDANYEELEKRYRATNPEDRLTGLEIASEQSMLLKTYLAMLDIEIEEE